MKVVIAITFHALACIAKAHSIGLGGLTGPLFGGVRPKPQLQPHAQPESQEQSEAVRVPKSDFESIRNSWQNRPHKEPQSASQIQPERQVSSELEAIRIPIQNASQMEPKPQPQLQSEKQPEPEPERNSLLNRPHKEPQPEAQLEPKPKPQSVAETVTESVRIPWQYRPHRQPDHEQESEESVRQSWLHYLAFQTHRPCRHPRPVKKEDELVAESLHAANKGDANVETNVRPSPYLVVPNLHKYQHYANN